MRNGIRPAAVAVAGIDGRPPVKPTLKSNTPGARTIFIPTAAFPKNTPFPTGALENAVW